MICCVINGIYKGVPRQAEVAQGVPGRLRSRIFLTFRHYKGGRSSAKRTGRLYPSRNPCSSLSETESTSGHMVLSGIPRKKFPVTPTGIDPETVRLVALTTTLPQAPYGICTSIRCDTVLIRTLSCGVKIHFYNIYSATLAANNLEKETLNLI